MGFLASVCALNAALSDSGLLWAPRPTLSVLRPRPTALTALLSVRGCRENWIKMIQHWCILINILIKHSSKMMSQQIGFSNLQIIIAPQDATVTVLSSLNLNTHAASLLHCPAECT